MGQRWLEEKEHATFACQFSNLLILNGIIIQLAFWCRYAVNNMHAHVLPTFLNGQPMRANMFAGQLVLFCGTKQPLFFGQKAKAPPPPPRVAYPKGHRVGSAPQVFCYAKVSTFMAPICLPYGHHLPQGGPYIALTIFGPNVRLNNISRTLL